MSNPEKPTQNKSEVLVPINAMSVAFAGLERAMQGQAHFVGEKLDEEKTDEFGVRNYKRLMIEDGGRAGIQELLNDKLQPDRTLMFSVIGNDGVKNDIGIGRMTDEIRNARDVSSDRDYLMLVRKGSDAVDATPYYLSDEQLSGITVAPHDVDVAFNSDTPDGKFIRFPGKIKNVALLEYRK